MKITDEIIKEVYLEDDLTDEIEDIKRKIAAYHGLYYSFRNMKEESWDLQSKNAHENLLNEAEDLVIKVADEMKQKILNLSIDPGDLTDSIVDGIWDFTKKMVDEAEDKAKNVPSDFTDDMKNAMICLTNGPAILESFNFAIGEPDVVDYVDPGDIAKLKSMYDKYKALIL